MKKIVFYGIFIIMGMALFEITLRASTLVSPTLDGMLGGGRKVDESTQLVIPDDTVIQKGNPDFPGHDAHGFRNKQVQDRADIIAMGDSQTYGVGVEREENWPSRLEALSGKTVYSMALGGWGPVQSFILLDDAVKLQPEIIIEAVYFGNDLYDGFSAVYDKKIFGQLISTKEDILNEIKKKEDERPYADIISDIYSKTYKIPLDMTEYTSVFKTYNFFIAIKNVIKNREFLGNSWNDIKKSARNKKKDVLEILEYKDIKTALTPPYRFLASNISDVRMAEGFRIVLQSLELMGDGLKKKNVTFIVVILPTKELAYKDAMEKSGIAMSDAYKQLAKNEEFLFSETTKYLSSKNIKYINMLPVLRKEIDGGNLPYFQNEDGHPNTTGHSIIAQQIQDYLLENNRAL